jgi:hypothetical protein
MVERHSFLECKPIWPNNLPRNRSTMQHNHLRHAWNNTIPLSTKVVQQPDCCPETCQSLKILKVKVIINTGAVNTSSDWQCRVKKTHCRFFGIVITYKKDTHLPTSRIGWVRGMFHCSYVFSYPSVAASNPQGKAQLAVMESSCLIRPSNQIGIRYDVTYPLVNEHNYGK